MILIYSAWFQELQQLKQRLAKMEEEISQLKETARVSSIEYHIQNLNVESISNGILDLGVHMGNEMDKRIQTQGEAERAPGTAQAAAANLESIVARLQQLEQSMMEVREQVQESAGRISEIETRCSEWEQRLQYLEAMHP